MPALSSSGSARTRRVRFVVPLALSATALTAARGEERTLRPELIGRHGIVAAGRSHAADAGARLLASGGNAIDAGIAALFASAVVEISHFGLGGESPMLIFAARDRRVLVINGQGPAPRAASPALFAGRASVPGNGPLGATIPAVVDAAALALAHHGTRSLGEVLAPAIALADGFPMYEFLRRHLESERPACEPYEWTMRTYYPGGRVVPAGETFRQPNLARTLRFLAEAPRAVTPSIGAISRAASSRPAVRRAACSRRKISRSTRAASSAPTR